MSFSMDIELKITPRLIERAVFIVAIAALLVSNLYFYNKSTASPQEKSEGLLAETTAANKTATTTTIKQESGNTTTTTTVESSANATEPANATSYKYSKLTPDKPDGSCTAGWKCYKPYYKGFVTPDCNWINVQNCVNGCENGQCKE